LIIGEDMGQAKIFKTLDEQIDLLRERGLVINDEEKAKDLLLRESYFFITAYRDLFMKSNGSHNYIEGTTFEELYAVFSFDRDLRNTMFKYLSITETNMKSIISYVLSKKYGYNDKTYLNPKNFSQNPMQSRQVRDILNKMKRQIRVNGNKHEATYHYINNYGYVPMWVLVKVLSYGIISELFNIMKTEDQLLVAENYNLDIETMSIYLSILSNFRNVCAHEDVLYTHHTQKDIPDSKYHQMLNIDQVDDEYSYGKHDLFCLIIILKEMLAKDEFDNMMSDIKAEVEELDAKVNTVSLNFILNRIGLPSNWYDITNYN
jgi:abortive infection bacteriophage resistance protein